MNANEASAIAWELVKIQECADACYDRVDGTMIIANEAMDAVTHILAAHPKVQKQFDLLYEPPTEKTE